ncbi:MAG: DUF3352 domain-containing protein [Angustibacter sp.]
MSTPPGQPGDEHTRPIPDLGYPGPAPTGGQQPAYGHPSHPQPAAASGSGYPQDDQPPSYEVLPATAARSTSGGRRRGALIGGGVLAVAVIGGGAALAASQLTGGGAQPDEAVPASAVAYFALDADPSSGQKVDYLRFRDKFPALKDAEDPGKLIFDRLKKIGSLTGDYATDVKPWLGDRAGLAVLPPAQSGEDPKPMVVLSIKDRDQAEAGIQKITKGDGACELTEDFAVCGADATTAKQAVQDAENASLADAANYSDDMSALGDQGIARAWVDLARLRTALPSGLGGGVSAASIDQLKGRVAVTLRFDGPTLEMAGSTSGVPGDSTVGGPVDVGSLPSDAVAAVSLGVADGGVKKAYDELTKSLRDAGAGDQVDQQVQALENQLGIAIPGDIAAAIGKRISLVVGADASTPQVALRMSGDKAAVDRIAGALSGQLEVGQAQAGSDTVLATDQSFADAVAKGSGLGGQELFTKAVPDAGDSQVVAFVDVSKVMSAFGDQFGLTSEQRAVVDTFTAVGMSARQDGDRSAFSIRLTTR